MDENTTTELPRGVRLEDVHGTPAVLVEIAACTAVIHRDGAHLTSWVPDGEDDVLWTSPDAVYAEGEPIRGGIPLIGPWFGPGRDGRSAPAHGWLRRRRWDLVSAERFHGWADEDADVVHSDSVAITLGLVDDDPAGDGISAQVHFAIAVDHLQVRLDITAGSAPLELEAALHTYLSVGDVRATRLHGLAGARYLDNLQDLRELTQDGEPQLTGPVDRVYDVDGPVTVHDEVLERDIVITPKCSTRTVLWNPWSDGAAHLSDMPLDAWQQFLCVETAVAKDGAVHLEPGQTHHLQARYEVSSR
ncbi:D-hexose-6-phosphate mutarotase [Brachybacterium phenoliresistens]|uniref:Putative glucose-6-phosphate 1-epimerase n=1 Tax=Brachybacterium phenoliresistens TaxID=396014 RepID=Z9JYL0_9MICO|nr:D-hexose-6-phosphate mutarotase [Brachybacterium phenoliresistens]EWS82882.1 aldose epimerase [Brachybacterium phenoliresistens]